MKNEFEKFNFPIINYYDNPLADISVLKSNLVRGF